MGVACSAVKVIGDMGGDGGIGGLERVAVDVVKIREVEVGIKNEEGLMNYRVKVEIIMLGMKMSILIDYGNKAIICGGNN